MSGARAMWAGRKICATASRAGGRQTALLERASRPSVRLHPVSAVLPRLIPFGVGPGISRGSKSERRALSTAALLSSRNAEKSTHSVDAPPKCRPAVVSVGVRVQRRSGLATAFGHCLFETCLQPLRNRGGRKGEACVENEREGETWGVLWTHVRPIPLFPFLSSSLRCLFSLPRKICFLSLSLYSVSVSVSVRLPFFFALGAASLTSSTPPFFFSSFVFFQSSALRVAVGSPAGSLRSPPAAHRWSCSRRRQSAPRCTRA